MLSNLPNLYETISSVSYLGMMFWADTTIILDFDFDAFDENEDICYKLYKSGEDYNLVISTLTVEEDYKSETEITILTVDGKIKAIKLTSNLFEDTRADEATEAVWTNAGSSTIELSLSYEFKDFSLLSADKFADYEVLGNADEVGSMQNMPL